MEHATASLKKTQALIELERSLTESMEKIEPWLLNPKNISNNGIRVRPIPTDMYQVEKVLAVSRNLSTRTSAPAGWNNGPVVGFSTPNPLPHQLRGGALAALELQRARQVERDKKRKRQEDEENHTKQKQEADSQKEDKNDTDVMDIDGDAGSKKRTASSNTDNIEQSENTRKNGQHHGNEQLAPISTSKHRNPKDAQPRPPTTMNLSDSSSSEDDDDSC